MAHSVIPSERSGTNRKIRRSVWLELKQRITALIPNCRAAATGSANQGAALEHRFNTIEFRSREDSAIRALAPGGETPNSSAYLKRKAR
jgi:hypothetical protein